jgi:transcriptional regulator with XRE-family HTH domain
MLPFAKNKWGGQVMYYSYMKQIRDLREDSDLTQSDIAKILGTSQTMYARYERGASELPIHHLITLCKFYQVSSDYLLGLSSSKSFYNSRL